ncbi:unnamed protein product [Linum tenue]|uniref:Uncharacterized protein n=1 Tax=Linum tenue TaxID=586396 RepID=A0AAV0KI83_9ROSI|nr:unnamed protein product [Linum tenue]
MAATTTETVAGLPRFVKLRSKSDDKYLRYLWSQEFAEFYKFMGTRGGVVDEVSPFVKLEVVPSTRDPASLVHLRSGENNLFLRPVHHRRLVMDLVAGVAESPNEDTSDALACTLFQPVFPPDQPDTVWFRYVPDQRRVFSFGAGSEVADVAVVFSQDARYTTFYEFSPWVSFGDKMKAKEEEIRSRDLEIQSLRALLGAREDEVRSVQRQLADRDDEIGGLEGEVAASEAYVEKWDARLEDAMLTLQSTVASAWEAFQVNVSAGIVKLAGGFNRFDRVLKLQDAI